MEFRIGQYKSESDVLVEDDRSIRHIWRWDAAAAAPPLHDAASRGNRAGLLLHKAATAPWKLHTQKVQLSTCGSDARSCAQREPTRLDNFRECASTVLRMARRETAIFPYLDCQSCHSGANPAGGVPIVVTARHVLVLSTCRLSLFACERDFAVQSLNCKLRKRAQQVDTVDWRWWLRF